MSQRELEIGSFVKVCGLDSVRMSAQAPYRIEQLLRLDTGTRLYKIRSDAEPFDRVVDEQQLIPPAATKSPA